LARQVRIIRIVDGISKVFRIFFWIFWEYYQNFTEFLRMLKRNVSEFQDFFGIYEFFCSGYEKLWLSVISLLYHDDKTNYENVKNLFIIYFNLGNACYFIIFPTLNFLFVLVNQTLLSTNVNSKSILNQSVVYLK
jgi:hypothetical protein